MRLVAIFLFIFNVMLSQNLWATSCEKVFTNEHPSQRFLVDIENTIKAFSEVKTTEELINLIMSEGFRNEFFRLQALSQLYKTASDKKVDSAYENKSNKEIFRELKASFKEIETYIGKYTLKLDLVEVAKQAQLPEDFISYLTANAQTNRNEFHVFLQSEGWFDGIPLLKAATALDPVIINKKRKNKTPMVKWVGLSEDASHKQLIVHEIIRNIDEILIEVKKKLEPLLLKEPFDFESLEGGLHELRRDILFVMIDLIAVKDMVGLSPLSELVLSDSLSLSDRKMVETYYDNKYLQDFETVTDSSSKIQLPALEIYRLTQLIDIFGKLNDYGEYETYLINEYTAYLQSKQEYDKNSELKVKIFIKARIKKNLKKTYDVKAETRAWYTAFEENNPLLAIRNTLSKNLNP